MMTLLRRRWTFITREEPPKVGETVVRYRRDGEHTIVASYAVTKVRWMDWASCYDDDGAIWHEVHARRIK